MVYIYVIIIVAMIGGFTTLNVWMLTKNRPQSPITQELPHERVNKLLDEPEEKEDKKHTSKIISEAFKDFDKIYRGR